MKSYLLLPKTSLSITFFSLLFFLFSSCQQDEIFEEISGEEFINGDTGTPHTEEDDEGCIHPDETVPSLDDSKLRTWNWRDLHIPPYSWDEGSSFGDGLHTDIAYDDQSVKIEGDQLRFRVHPLSPAPPSDASGDFNFRSEIRTAPWRIRHPLGTEQWIGWSYTFGENYVPDHTSPITIFQNHPGISGLSPVFEVTIAKRHNHLQNPGGEVEFVNKGNDDRENYSKFRPMAGDKLKIVVHVVYGIGEDGLLELWLDDELVYSKRVSTVYGNHQYGGNNKWGVYHHTFNGSESSVYSSLDIGAGDVELKMSSLRLLTRTPSDTEYRTNAFEMVSAR